MQEYPTWESLKEYLESDKGGHFRISEPNEKGLVMIRYEKGISKMDLPHVTWFRSVVWDTGKHCPVSMAPSRATSSPLPVTRLKEAKQANLVCEEFLDGFMINCFRLTNEENMYISSRSKLDATGTFYSSKTFRQLFLESYFELNDHEWPMSVLEERFQKEIKEDEGQMEEKKQGVIAVGYSFLVQHRENRIVTPILQNRVILIQKSIFYESGEVEIYDHFDTFRGQVNMQQIPLHPFLSRNTYADLVRMGGVTNDSPLLSEWIKDWLEQQTWKVQGLVLKDKEGHRWRFRSDKYMIVKNIRGNHSNSLERFSQLYTQQLTSLYLEYYPEDSNEWNLNSLCMNQVIHLIYRFYLSLHVMKTVQPTQIDKMYLPHLYHLHGIYLSELKPQKKKLTLLTVQSYFQKQPWQRIAFLIRKNKDSYFQS